MKRTICPIKSDFKGFGILNPLIRGFVDKWSLLVYYIF